MSLTSNAEKRRDRRLWFKWNARRAMTQKGNLIRLILGILFFIMFSDAFMYLYNTVILLLCRENTHALMTAEIIIYALVISPLFYGLMRMTFLMAEGRESKIPDLLWGYDFSARRRKLYDLLIKQVFRGVVVSAVSYFGVLWIAYTFFEKENDFKALAISPVILIAAFFVAIVLSGLMPFSFVLPEICFLEEDGINVNTKEVKKNARRSMVEISLFNLSFLGLTVLSVLTLGILHFVYILPYYLLARANFASYIISCKK